jgi:DNA ligase D-like protein (predicted 3'-phosphoesterase)
MNKDTTFEEYRSKRDFRKTPEPPGDNGASAQRKRIFVIQKHDASKLHYDFRIEIEGALMSWVIPKGPSTDPREKRLAVPTEDHPLDYADFEGVIADGEYGGGSVMVWDAGRYRNLKTDDDGNEIDMRQCVDSGHVEISLYGKKLRGGYALIRTGGKSQSKPRWLIIKMKDDQADARRNPTSTENKSVLTNRTMKQIAAEAKKESNGKED